MNVVITGATGVIGRSLIDNLLKKGIYVSAIIRENSTAQLPQNNNLEIIRCDLQNICKLNLNKKYDVFYHLAWDGTTGETRDDLYLQNLNIKYTLDAVELAKRLECHTFIGAGSQAEYGRVDGVISTTTPTFPENGYGIAKLSAGYMSRILSNKYGIRHIWTRIFSVYGPYNNENTLIIKSIKEMIENGESPKYTKGEQKWDYIYSKDVAEALYLIAKKGKENSIYCIAQGKTRPLYEYINIIRDKIDKKINLKLGAIDYSKNQVMNLQADISNLQADTRVLS